MLINLARSFARLYGRYGAGMPAIAQSQVVDLAADLHLYRGVMTTSERNALLCARFAALKRARAERPVATAKIASEVVVRKRGS